MNAEQSAALDAVEWRLTRLQLDARDLARSLRSISTIPYETAAEVQVRAFMAPIMAELDRLATIRKEQAHEHAA